MNIEISLIHNLLRDKRHWIHKKILQQQKRLVPARQFTHTEDFLYLGNNYKLQLIDNARFTLKLEDAFLLDRRYFSNVRNEFIRWYKEKAELVISERVRFYSIVSGLKYQKINISHAQHRWGSCSREGRLNFSWRLIMAPLKIIDYVVVHEIAHLEVKNHSRRFWRTVAGLFPEYKICGQWLKENGHLLII